MSDDEDNFNLDKYLDDENNEEDDEIETDVFKLRNKIIELKNFIEILTMDKDNISLEKEILEEENNLLKKEVSMLNEYKSSSLPNSSDTDRENSFQLFKELNDLKEENANYKQALINLNEINNQNENKIQILSSNLADLQKERNMYKEKNIILEEKNRENSILIDSLSDSELIIENLTEKNDRFNEEIHQVKLAIENLTEENNNLQLNMMKNNELLQSKKRYIEEIEELNSKNQITLLNNEKIINELKNTKKNNEANINKLKQLLIQFQNSINSNKNSNEKLKTYNSLVNFVNNLVKINDKSRETSFYNSYYLSNNLNYYSYILLNFIKPKNPSNNLLQPAQTLDFESYSLTQLSSTSLDKTLKYSNNIYLFISNISSLFYNTFSIKKLILNILSNLKIKSKKYYQLFDKVLGIFYVNHFILYNLVAKYFYFLLFNNNFYYSIYYFQKEENYSLKSDEKYKKELSEFYFSLIDAWVSSSSTPPSTTSFNPSAEFDPSTINYFFQILNNLKEYSNSLHLSLVELNSNLEDNFLFFDDRTNETDIVNDNIDTIFNDTIEDEKINEFLDKIDSDLYELNNFGKDILYDLVYYSEKIEKLSKNGDNGVTDNSLTILLKEVDQNYLDNYYHTKSNISVTSLFINSLYCFFSTNKKSQLSLFERETLLLLLSQILHIFYYNYLFLNTPSNITSKEYEEKFEVKDEIICLIKKIIHEINFLIKNYNKLDNFDFFTLKYFFNFFILVYFNNNHTFLNFISNNKVKVILELKNLHNILIKNIELLNFSSFTSSEQISTLFYPLSLFFSNDPSIKNLQQNSTDYKSTSTLSEEASLEELEKESYLILNENNTSSNITIFNNYLSFLASEDKKFNILTEFMNKYYRLLISAYSETSQPPEMLDNFYILSIDFKPFSSTNKLLNSFFSFFTNKEEDLTSSSNLEPKFDKEDQVISNISQAQYLNILNQLESKNDELAIVLDKYEELKQSISSKENQLNEVPASDLSLTSSHPVSSINEKEIQTLKLSLHTLEVALESMENKAELLSKENKLLKNQINLLNVPITTSSSSLSRTNSFSLNKGSSQISNPNEDIVDNNLLHQLNYWKNIASQSLLFSFPSNSLSSLSYSPTTSIFGSELLSSHFSSKEARKVYSTNRTDRIKSLRVTRTKKEETFNSTPIFANNSQLLFYKALYSQVMP